MAASSLDISAGREKTPCHFIYSSPVNLSVLLNILHSFRNDRAHYTLCFRRSSLTYSALTYFALKEHRGEQIFPAQCTAKLRYKAIVTELLMTV